MELLQIIVIACLSVIALAIIGLILIGLEDPDEDGYGEPRDKK